MKHILKFKLSEKEPFLRFYNVSYQRWQKGGDESTSWNVSFLNPVLEAEESTDV